MSDNTGNVILHIEHIKKYFPVRDGFSKSTVRAVDDVTLDVFEGETLGIVGESGSGKTTLANMILGLLPPTEGSISIQGVDVTSRKGHREMYKLAGAVFQDPASSLNPRFTVYRSLERPLVMHGISKTEAKDRIMKVCEQVKIGTELLERYPNELSGGQQQRVSIARAILLSSRLLVLDEPTSALDVSVQAQTLNELLDLQEKNRLTYLFITHNLSVVRYMADRLCVMYGGQIMELGATEEIYSNLIHPYTASLFDSIPPVHPKYRKKEKRLIDGEMPSLINVRDECRFASRCRFCTDECRSKTPQLREIRPGHFVACCRAEEICAGTACREEKKDV